MFPKADLLFPGNGADFRVIKLLAIVMNLQGAFWKML